MAYADELRSFRDYGAGIASGNVVPSLTLAPVPLAAMAYLVAVAPRQAL